MIVSLTMLMLTAMPPAGAYVLEPSETYLLVQLRPDESRLLSGLSHTHVVRATKPSGDVEFDPTRPKACRILVLANVADLEVDSPKLRERVGLKGVLSPSDIEDVKENMLDDDQLHAKKYPDIGFVGSECRLLPDGQLQVQGSLTVRGVSKAVTLPMQVDYRRGVMTAKGQLTLKHADFGFEPYSTAFGALANDDWLHFTIDVVARRKNARRPKAPESTQTSSSSASEASTP